MVAEQTTTGPLAVRDDDHVLGNPNAGITMIEYADFQCPYCGMAEPMVRQLREKFGDSLRYVFREYPLVDSHRYALLAARAAEAAAAQGKFWEMHDLLFANQQNLGDDTVVALADEIGLDVDRFVGDVEDGQQDGKIERDMRSGDEAEVPGTPTFFINGSQYFGPPRYQELEAEIRQALG